MQLTFSKQVIVDRTYKCSVASFMKNHYSGYGRYENELDILCSISCSEWLSD